MKLYGPSALERAMKIQEVILRAMSAQLKWTQAADILAISPRSLRRWRGRYELYGYDGLLDRRTGKPSPRRAPVAEVEKVLRLYRERYQGFNVRHFHGIARREHEISLSYSFVKKALQDESAGPCLEKCSIWMAAVIGGWPETQSNTKR
jgi:transposase